MKHTFFEKFHIPRLDSNEQKLFIQLSEEVIRLKKENHNADTGKLEREIDLMVYELYGLTPEEVQIVEESLK